MSRTVKTPDGNKIIVSDEKYREIRLAKKARKAYERLRKAEENFEKVKEYLVEEAKKDRAEFNTKMSGVAENSCTVTYQGFLKKVTLTSQVTDKLDTGLAQKAMGKIDEYLTEGKDTGLTDEEKLLSNLFTSGKHYRVTPRLIKFISADWDDERLQRAQEILSDAVTVSHSNVYIQVKDIYQDSPLDTSELDFSIGKLKETLKELAEDPENLTTKGHPYKKIVRERLGYDAESDRIDRAWQEIQRDEQ